MRKIISTLVAIVFVALSSTASAITIGETSDGWTLDLDKVSDSQKRSFGWNERRMGFGFKPAKDNNSSPGAGSWTFSRRTLAVNNNKGPAWFSFMQLLDDSTMKEVKLTQYMVMAENGVFQEKSCEKLSNGAELCSVSLRDWGVFYLASYQWKTSTGTFVVVVRNAQSTPDRKTVEEAIGVLVPLIKTTGDDSVAAKN